MTTEGAAAWFAAESQSGETYLALAWFAPGRGKRTDAVRAKRCISADIDAKAMPGSDSEARLHQARTLARCLPCPSVVVGSGGGFHPHVLLPESLRVEDYDDPADGVKQVELLARALRLYLEARARELFGTPVSLDHCHGAERVWRAPPGWNAKSADRARSLTADRGTWRAVTLEVPGHVEGLASTAVAEVSFLRPYLDAAWDEEALNHTAPQAPATADAREGQNRASSAGGVAVAVAAAGGAYFEPRVLPDRQRAKWPMREGDQSDHDFAVASALAEDGWSPATARAAIVLRRGLLADAEDRAKGTREDYLDLTVRKAYAKVPRPPAPKHLAPYRPFPTDALPPLVREFALVGARVLGCALEAVLLPLLCVLGAAIGNSRRIGLKRSWSEPPVIWAAVSLSSGSRKSPALDLATAALNKRQHKALQEFNAAYSEYLLEKVRYEAEHQKWKKDGGEGEPPEPPARPVAFRCKVGDTTVEALAPVLEENQRGVCLIRDELAAWLKSFDAYRQGRGGDREAWLTIHRAGAILVDRKMARQIISVERAFVGVCGGIQPRTLKRLLTGEFFECGLPARLLIASPPSPRRRWTDEEIPAALEDALARVQERLHGILSHRGDDGQVGPFVMRLTPEAKDVWVEFYDSFAGRQQDVEEDDDMGAAFAKIEGYAARLALIVCLAQWAEGATETPPDHVDADSVRAGITLARWFADETERIYAKFRESEGQASCRRLVSWLRSKGGRATVRDVQRGLRVYREDAEAAQAALSAFVTAGLGWRIMLPPRPDGGAAMRAFELRADLLSGGDGDATPTAGLSSAGPKGDVSPGCLFGEPSRS